MGDRCIHGVQALYEAARILLTNLPIAGQRLLAILTVRPPSRPRCEPDVPGYVPVQFPR